jgi:polygalacturonase
MSIGSETNTGDSFLLVDGLTEDHTTSGIRIKSNATRGGLVHDLVYRNICIRDVPIPIAISPYYNNQTVEGFVDPGIKGDKIPDYRNITLENITDETPGDVLIAGYDEAHRTEVNLKSVTVRGITPAQVHVKFADIVDADEQIPFMQAADPKNAIVAIKLEGNPNPKPYSCEGKFVPMQ